MASDDDRPSNFTSKLFWLHVLRWNRDGDSADRLPDAFGRRCRKCPCKNQYRCPKKRQFCLQKTSRRDLRASLPHNVGDICMLNRHIAKLYVSAELRPQAKKSGSAEFLLLSKARSKNAQMRKNDFFGPKKRVMVSHARA